MGLEDGLRERGRADERSRRRSWDKGEEGRGRKRKEENGRGRKKEEEEGRGRKRKEEEGRGRKRKEEGGKGRMREDVFAGLTSVRALGAIIYFMVTGKPMFKPSYEPGKLSSTSSPPSSFLLPPSFALLPPSN
jgi:hypothetical protein